MAKLKKLTLSNQKKVIITDYLDPEIIEEGKEEFVTVKKLDHKTKKFIEYLSINSYETMKSKGVVKAIKDSGKSWEEIESMPLRDKGYLLADMDTTDINADDMTNNAVEMAKLIINNGLLPDKHSFVDENDAIVAIDYDFCSEYFSEDLIINLMEEIKSISKGFSLEK